jgi:RNA polymerase sigma-70 factor (ECF subfamily)
MAMALPSDQAEGTAVTPFPEDRYVDAKLVREAATGDTAALGLVWDRYSKLVRSVIHGVLGPDGAIDDLVQDVFLAFLRGAARIEDGGALRGYLVGVAVRLGALEIRKRKVRRWVGLSPTGNLPDVPVEPVDSEAREALRALYRVLDRLGSRKRLAFSLRHVQGLELRDIAAAMGISEATVYRELRRAEQQVVALARREPTLSRYVDRSGFGRRQS